MKIKVNWERFARHQAHQTQIAILDYFSRVDTPGALSPKQLTDALDEQGLSGIAYHVGRLVELGVLELAGTEPRRGAVEHFYRVVGP